MKRPVLRSHTLNVSRIGGRVTSVEVSEKATVFRADYSTPTGTQQSLTYVRPGRNHSLILLTRFNERWHAAGVDDAAVVTLGVEVTSFDQWLEVVVRWFGAVDSGSVQLEPAVAGVVLPRIRA